MLSYVAYVERGAGLHGPRGSRYGGQHMSGKLAASTPLRMVLAQEHARRKLREVLARQVTDEGTPYEVGM